MYRNLGIGSWIARRARMTPSRVALCFQGRSWSYRELDVRITQLARALEGLGVGMGDRVAFLGQNHPSQLESLFACGLLGAVFVPLHPGFDDAALTRVLADCEPKVLVVTSERLGTLRRIRPELSVEHYVTVGLASADAESFESLVACSSEQAMDRPVRLEHAAILAYSSGTTGPNKGVRLTHENLFFNAMNVLSWLDYRGDDVILSSAPLYRMGGLGFLLPLLFKGGTCVLQERADPEMSLQLIEQHRVTVLFDAVGALDALRQSPAFAQADLSSLRITATGGTDVPRQLVEAFAERGLCLQPGYGLTEAAPLALLTPRDEVRAHPEAAGRPPIFCAVRVVDRCLQDVGPGEPGELLVHGPNVMAGYWNAPDGTLRALVDGGWLRTGDAARQDESGVTWILGRVADALLLGGREIHPAPIEARVRQLGGVLDCAIVQREPEGTPLVYVVPGGDVLALSAVAALCRALIGTSGPLELFVVDALARNPNGKLLRAPLRAKEGWARKSA